jgi:hypothetical protein
VKPFSIDEYLEAKGLKEEGGFEAVDDKRPPFVGETVTKTESMNLNTKPSVKDSKVETVSSVNSALVRVPN